MAIIYLTEKLFMDVVSYKSTWAVDQKGLLQIMLFKLLSK